MIELFGILFPIALIDSMSMLPVCILPLIFLLTSHRPVLNTSMFILGILIVYIPFGLLLAFGLSAVFDAIGQSVNEWISKKPDGIDLFVQFLIGISLLTIGRLIARKRVSKAAEEPNLVVTPALSFNFSALLTLTGLWGALPYFAAVDQIIRAEVSNLIIVFGLIFYNVIFVAPVIVLFIIGLILGPGAKPFLERVADFIMRYGRQLIAIVLFILGLLLIADAVGWYLEYPIIPIGPYAQ